LGTFDEYFLEQYKGAFPTWLAPTQIRVIPVSLDNHDEYAKKINDLFIDYNLRSELDMREEKLGYKIRAAQTEKIPYQIVVGDDEVANETVTYRKYGEKEQITVPIKDFVDLIQEEIIHKSK